MATIDGIAHVLKCGPFQRNPGRRTGEVRIEVPTSGSCVMLEP